MTELPYVLLSCATSVDGRLDAPGPRRLLLSGPADADRVDAERAGSDAIMIGAGTIRRDNPRLLIRSPERRAARAARGLPEHPARVTVTVSGDLDPQARFFAGAAENACQNRQPQRLVYSPPSVAAGLRSRLAGRARVVGAGEPLSLRSVLADLGRRGIRRLMVEGGASLGTHLLAEGLVDELHLVIAPFFVGDAAAPRFAGPARYPHGPGRPMLVAEVRRLDDVVLLRYLLSRGEDASRREPGAADG